MLVRTRFAPSPTGVLHIGSIRTALYCWLFARHHQGEFVVRIEDTDRKRSTQKNVSAIMQGLQWLGLEADEPPVYQSHRTERYHEVIGRWLTTGKAYYCYCSKGRLDSIRERQLVRSEFVGYDGRCRNGKPAGAHTAPVVRFRNPQNGKVIVNDRVRGNVEFDNAQLDDLIIARADGTPTYNFSVVVDDADMRISHVIRGDDHLNNTPRQINMFAALGVNAPKFAHLPMILGADGAKLSKRHGAVDIRDYRDAGYLADAMLNYLVRLGWSHGNQEIFSIEEMIASFDISDVNQSASALNPEKLRWINQQHIQSKSADELGALLLPFLESAGINPKNGPDPSIVANAYRQRAETLLEMSEKSRFCYQDFESFDAAAAKKNLRPVVLEPLRTTRAALNDLAEWTRQEIATVIEATATEYGISLGKLGQPLRVAVTGGAVSPPIDETLLLVGKNRTIARIDRAISFVEERASN